jgi:hypothetical protein
MRILLTIVSGEIHILAGHISYAPIEGEHEQPICFVELWGAVVLIL